MATFQSNVDLSLLWDGSDELCSTSISSAELHGCLFHLTKSMRRQLSENGLLQRYNVEPRFALHARIIAALSFVPIDNLDDAFDALSNQLANELTPILNWLEDNYIGRSGRDNCRTLTHSFRQRFGACTSAQ